LKFNDKHHIEYSMHIHDIIRMNMWKRRYLPSRYINSSNIYEIDKNYVNYKGIKRFLNDR